jgi:glycosyltransferase involved in cell wall biosynthesis
MSHTKAIAILGTRGVPAAHGGFETFAEQLALYLVQRGWHVVVYCQEEGHGPPFVDEWRGVHRVHIPVVGGGPASTIRFDWKATRHAARARLPCLTLGYNTAVFCSLLRLAGVHNTINMDGIEWQRAKWGMLAKAWFRLNEWAGCKLGNQLVADHPEIARHLAAHAPPARITTIPYGAESVQEAPVDPVRALGLEPGRYLTLIARPEPENSVLEVVQGFSRHARGQLLAVLGHYRDDNAYHRAVRSAAGPEVRFLGAIYDKTVVQALRVHCTAYVHGHQVGGTNPSLVEALGAGNAVIAHDNRFNRWVAGDAAVYFDGAEGFAAALSRLLDETALTKQLQATALRRFADHFTWPSVLSAYENLLLARGA